MLAGMEPWQPSQSLGQVYLSIDLLLTALLLIALWPLVQLHKWHRWLRARQQSGSMPVIRVGLRSAAEIAFALVFLIGVRLFIVEGLGAQSWYEVLAVFPDFVVWIWVFALAIFLTGVLRMKLILQTRRSRARADEPALDTPLASSL